MVDNYPHEEGFPMTWAMKWVIFQQDYIDSLNSVSSWELDKFLSPAKLGIFLNR